MEGMDFIERINEMVAQLRKRVPHCQTEEATKMSLILPFLEKVLGWDPSDPHQLVPEYAADIGTKRGEKVDYAIMVDDKPAILIEAKKVGTALGREPKNQLYRYFACTSAHFAILTDGIQYLFFADLDDENRMDPQPFFTINLFEIDGSSVAPLQAFSRTRFDVEENLELARDLRCTGQVENLLREVWARPSASFIKWIMGEVHEGPRPKRVKERYERTCKTALHAFLARESVRLKDADSATRKQEAKPAPKPEPEPTKRGTKTRAASTAPLAEPKPVPTKRDGGKGVPTTVTIGNWTETFNSLRGAVFGAWKQLDAVHRGFMQTWADASRGQGRGRPVVSMDSDAVPQKHRPLKCASGTWYVPGHGSRDMFTSFLRRSCEANGLELGKDVILADADDA